MLYRGASRDAQRDDRPVFQDSTGSGISPLIAAFVLAASQCSNHAASLPDPASKFLESYCLDCHDMDSQKGELNLDPQTIDWKAPAAPIRWMRVHDALESGEMPPKKKRQPTTDEKAAFLKWLRESLRSHNRPGGTTLRRLNRAEYENSVRAALGIPFSVPSGFPADTKLYGFDNQGEGLVLSPPLMQKYFELAGMAADMIIPPPKKVSPVPAETISISPDEMSMAFEGVQFRDGVMRLVTKEGVLIRSCSWPTRFEASHTGTYSISTRLSSFKAASDAPLEVELIVVKPSMTFTKLSGLRRASAFAIPADGKIHAFSADIDLEKGETIAFYWRNAVMGSADIANRKTQLDQTIRTFFEKNPKMHAAWIKMGGFDRKRSAKSTWQMLKNLAADPALDPARDDPRSRYPATDANQLSWALQNMRMENGPALDIHGVEFHGPTRLTKSKDDNAQVRRAARFLGARNGRSDPDYANSILRPFLEAAFRRPIKADTLNRYVEMALAHRRAGNRFEDGIHLAVRAALCSPNFLFRGQREGRLDAYDLASRLSYFLTSGPPDAQLAKLAASGRLSNQDVLADSTRRLLASGKAQAFLESFIGQWLHLDALPDIMPDERLLKWLASDLAAITGETHMFVADLLKENRPLEDFIDPDFTYLNRRNAKLYGLDKDRRNKGRFGDDLERVAIERGGRRGGILGQASVMMATANGVDTQPVLRGVWLLENILGDPPPEPPTGVPAIEPDTSGARSIRELLARHQADPNCAGCHRKIDPPGFALENFDPVGRWREFYPVYEKSQDGKVVARQGLPVESATVLHDGTRLKDVTDLKRYLVDNIDQFSRCLAGKLLTYATGRPPNFGDREEIGRIVQEVKAKGNGFRDLIVALALSDSFRTK